MSRDLQCKQCMNATTQKRYLAASKMAIVYYVYICKECLEAYEFVADECGTSTKYRPRVQQYYDVAVCSASDSTVPVIIESLNYSENLPSNYEDLQWETKRKH